MTESAAIAATRDWLKRFVIGLDLCPFAVRPFQAGRIRYVDCPATDPREILVALYAEIALLVEADPVRDSQAPETTLFVLGAGLSEFDAYLDVLESAQADLEDSGLIDHLQLASFHPDYRFADAPGEDPANYTNRSPWPMFHLIRQDSLSAALAHYANPEAIPERNAARLRALGLAQIRALISAEGGQNLVPKTRRSD